MIDERPVVLVALMSLAAEGTPRMTLALCGEWLAQGVRPVVVVLEGTPTDLAPEFKALGVECVLLDIRKAGFRRYGALAVGFFTLARQYRAKALLSMPLGWHTFMALGARLGGVRRVIAHVGNYPNPASGHAFTKFRMLVQLGRPLTDQLVCCSRYVRHGAIKHFGVGEREAIVVHNGVPSDAFTSRAPTPERQRPGPFVIGMVARLEKHKDHAALINAARILKDRGRDIAVGIVGEGSQRGVLQHLIDSQGLTDVVRLLGMRRDVPEVLAEFDLFVFSTTTDEGFGIALVEAMLAGIPIVASAVGACREVLDEGRLWDGPRPTNR